MTNEENTNMKETKQMDIDIERECTFFPRSELRYSDATTSELMTASILIEEELGRRGHPLDDYLDGCEWGATD
jgi:hypothetical protein